MIRVLAAAALAVGVPMIVLVVCYAVSRIPLVQRKFCLDDNDSLVMKVFVGFIAIIIYIIGPVALLFLFISLFVMFYSLL